MVFWFFCLWLWNGCFGFVRIVCVVSLLGGFVFDDKNLFNVYFLEYVEIVRYGFDLIDVDMKFELFFFEFVFVGVDLVLMGYLINLIMGKILIFFVFFLIMKVSI